MVYEQTPNPGLPMRYFEKNVQIHQKKNRFEQKIPVRH